MRLLIAKLKFNLLLEVPKEKTHPQVGLACLRAGRGKGLTVHRTVIQDLALRVL